jgi:aminoglycoside phosphotransferase (APT) family kinase protein
VLADHTGSIPIDQIEGASLETAELVVDTMAAMHAAWWDRKELTSFDFVPPLDEQVEERSAARIRESFPQFAARWRDSVPASAFRAAERYSQEIARMYHRWAANGPHTLMHNDLRLDNMLLVESDGVRSMLFVDWQRSIRFHGACDLAYFLAGSLTVEDRRRHEFDLKDRYHERLREAGVVGYSHERLDADYRAGMLRWLGLVTTVGLLDFANERGERLARTMIERHFTAAADHDVDRLLDE